MRTVISKLCGLLVLLAMTAGCGQKAPLFLPGDPAAVKSDVPGQYKSEPSPNESDDTDDEDDK